MAASPRSKQYGAASAKVRYWANARMVGVEPASAFGPRPNVDSALGELVRHAPPPTQPGLAGRSLLITGGERDPIAPAAATRALAGWFTGQGAPVRTLLHPGGHELRSEELAAVREFLMEGPTFAPA